MTARRLTGFLPRLGQRGAGAAPASGSPGRAVVSPAAPAAADPVFPTRALRTFLDAVRRRPAAVLLDLGPVIGPNITFLGEEVSCKIHVEDLFADVDRHVRQSTVDTLPDFLRTRLRLPDASVDGVLCWDLIDYLDAASAGVLAGELVRVLRPGGVLLGLFATAASIDPRYTKYVIVDDQHLRYRPYPAARGRQRVLENRDIIRLFDRLRVSDSVLLKSALREVLFRYPTPS